MPGHGSGKEREEGGAMKGVASGSAAVVYVVQQLHGEDLRQCLSGPMPVATFAERDAAEADCAERERQARARVNPFRRGGASLADLTSLEPAVWHDWLLDAGVAPPAPGPDGVTDWGQWWDAEQGRWDELQRARVWQGLDRMRFFAVVEGRPRRRVYVVIEIGWSWHDSNPWDADAEGGRPLQAFATRERAEARCAELEQVRRDNGEFNEYATFDLSARAGYQQQPYFRLEEAPLYEVIEVDWEEEGP
jgi:hypothetical protein